MVHIIFDGSAVKLENFVQAGEGGIAFFEGMPPRYQRGYGHFAGNMRQRGNGLGDVFRSLWRVLRPVVHGIGTTVGPIAKEAGKAIGKEGLATGAHVLNDLVQGQNLQDSLTSEGREEAKRLLDKASRKLQRGTGRRTTAINNSRKGRRSVIDNVRLMPGDTISPNEIVDRKRPVASATVTTLGSNNAIKKKTRGIGGFSSPPPFFCITRYENEEREGILYFDSGPSLFILHTCGQRVADRQMNLYLGTR